MHKSFLLLAVSGFCLSSFAEVFYISTAASGKYCSFADPTTWYTSWTWVKHDAGDGKGDYVENGANPESKVPTSDDYLHILHGYHETRYLDLDNTSYSVKGWNFSEYREQYGYRDYYLKNGTLTFTESCTNTRQRTWIHTGGKLVFGPECEALMGRHGAQCVFNIQNGGEVDIGGRYTTNPSQFYVDAGGKLTFHPSKLILGTIASPANIFRNNGTMDFPEGLTIEGVAGHGTSDNEGGNYWFEQRAGTMTIGGPIVRNSTAAAKYHFLLKGGTLKIEDDVDMSFFRTVGITNENTSATIDIDEGKTLSWANATFATGAAVTKTGLGTLKLGASIPDSLQVEEGVFVVPECNWDETYAGSVSLADGTALRLDGCVTATAIDNLENITLTIGDAIAYDNFVFKSTDAALLEAVKAKLVLSMPDADFMILDGGIYYFAKRESQIFYRKVEALKAYTDPSSWVIGTTSSGTNPDNLYPGPNDYHHYLNGYNLTAAYDFGGRAFVTRGFSERDYKEGYGFRYLDYRNGTLYVTGSYTNFRVIATLDQNARLVLTDTCSAKLSKDGASENTYNIRSGCEVDIYASLEYGVVRFNVSDGGTLKFDPKVLNLGNVAFKGANASYFNNSGTMEFPHGVAFAATAGHTTGNDISFNQNAGTMLFGGTISRTANAYGTFHFNLNGGLLRIADDVSMACLDTVGMPTENTAATIEVAADKTLDWANATFAAGTTLTKTGAGTLTLGAMAPAVMTVSEGALDLSKSVTFASLVTAAGTRLVLTDGTPRIDVWTGVEDAEIEVNLADRPLGTFLVQSSDTALLTTIQAKIEVPDGLELVIRGDALVLVKSSTAANVFSASGVLNLADPSGWGDGTVPAEGADVVVTGPDTTAILASTNVVYNSITVADGATLRIDDTISTLPQAVMLNYDARILFAKGATAVPAGMIQAKALVNSLPVIEIASGATYVLGGGTAFKNVHLKVYGKIQAQNPGTDYYFGTADANETTYFALTAENADFDFISEGHVIYWASPKSTTGRVVVPTKLSFKDATFRSSWNTTFGYSVGYRNPKDEIIVMELDNTLFDMRMGGEGFLAGGLKVLCKNGGVLAKPYAWTSPGTYGHPYLQQNFQAVYDGPGSSFHYAWNRNPVEIRPDDNGYEQMTFKNGAHLHIMNFRGNDKAIFGFEDGYWDLTERPGFDANYWPKLDPPVAEEDTWTALVSPFTGLKSVRIGDGKFLGLRAFSQNPGTYNEREWNRVMKLANVPVTGENGSMFVTNMLANYTCEAILVCGENTATGELTAYPSGAGCRLTLADGANWAGTLVANECIGFTNLTTATSPATVAVNNVRFAGNFPIRAWKNAGVSDQLVISGSLSRVKGGFTPVAMDGAFVEGDTVVVGTCPAASLPADYEKALSSGHWVLSAEPIPDTENVTLKVTYRKAGLYMILL